MAAYFEEENFTSGPHRDTQFDTQILEAPVRLTGERSGGGGAGGHGGGGGGEALSAGYYPPTASEASSSFGRAPIPDRSSGQTAFGAQSKFKGDTNPSGRMPTRLIITSLVFRAAAVVSLIVAFAVLASMSHTLTDPDSLIESTYTFSFFSSTKYAMAVAIVGAAYSIYETVSVVVRLAMGHHLLPGNVSLIISYIGDQVVVVLLLTGASAAAATFKDLHDFPFGGSYCDVLGELCKQGAGATAMIFLGFGFLAASLVISSLCFYKRKI